MTLVIYGEEGSLYATADLTGVIRYAERSVTLFGEANR